MFDRSWMNTPVLRTIVMVGATAALAGCSLGNYRVVKTVPQKGGEVALVGVQNEAREKAEGYMRGQCPSGYDIVEEGEAVVGQEQVGSRRGYMVRSETNDKHEWRIKYQCKGAAPAAAPLPTGTQGQIHELIVRF